MLVFSTQLCELLPPVTFSLVQLSHPSSLPCVQHKIHIYTEYHSVCPLVGIWTLPSPLSPASVPLPRYQRGGGTRLRVRGWGSPNSDDRGKSLALCLLCGIQCVTGEGISLSDRETPVQLNFFRWRHFALLSI
jgi:hypothetical protein